MTQSALIATFALALVTLFSRMLPFIFVKKMSPRMERLGQLLPAHIMLLLVIYEINIETFFKPPYGLPALTALLVLTCSQLQFRNTLLTLSLSMATYFIMIHFIH